MVLGIIISPGYRNYIIMVVLFNIAMFFHWDDIIIAVDFTRPVQFSINYSLRICSVQGKYLFFIYFVLFREIL